MSKELSTKHKWVITIAILLSAVAIIFSTITLCSVYPNENLGFDYLGIMVGILTLLITVLIGWQIFSLINLKEIEKENIKLKKTIFEEIYLEFGFTYKSNASNSVGMFNQSKRQSFIHASNIIYYSIYAIQKYTQAGDFDTANKIISNFSNDIPVLEETDLTPNKKAFIPLIDILTNLKFNSNLDKENLQTIINKLNNRIDDAIRKKATSS